MSALKDILTVQTKPGNDTEFVKLVNDACHWIIEAIGAEFGSPDYFDMTDVALGEHITPSNTFCIDHFKGTVRCIPNVLVDKQKSLSVNVRLTVEGGEAWALTFDTASTSPRQNEGQFIERVKESIERRLRSGS